MEMEKGSMNMGIRYSQESDTSLNLREVLTRFLNQKLLKSQWLGY
jgi:hypothetical protein